METKIVDKLRVVVFGGSGMVGAAVIDHCLRNPDVERILAVGRSPCGFSHPKLQELRITDLWNIADHAAELTGWNACFFTLGISVAGLSEDQYARTTHDLTLAIAKFLLERNPDLAFTYVSGVGTDSTAQGKSVWARVKGRTENDLLSLPFRAWGMFRLGMLVPLKNHPSKTRLYRIFYTPVRPILPLVARILPGLVTTPDILGKAMVRVAQGRSNLRILEPVDFDRLARSG